MEEIVAVDIGGTNARFCRARLRVDVPPELATIRKYKVADHSGLADAWRRFAEDEGVPLPPYAAIALAAPTNSTPIRLTNSHWVIDPDRLRVELALDRLAIVNDFEAIAHGVTALPPDQVRHLFGPERGLPTEGVVTVLGPGTGLGVCMIAMTRDGPHILATEGGHMDFAPADEIEDRLLRELRKRFSHVSAERVVSGPGLNLLYQAFGALSGKDVPTLGDADLWQAALSGSDGMAAQALARLCLCYGAVAGDLALAQGSRAVVLAGALTGRMCSSPQFQGFHARFLAKGRYVGYMADLPVLYADHPEFGLFGAAVAGAKFFRS